MTIEIRTSTDNRESTETRVIDILDAQAEDKGYPFVMRHYAFEAWDGEDFLGGLVARMAQDWMFVALLAVAPEARGKGIGTQLIATAERAAKADKATGIWLDTFSFQAPGFYERVGFRRIATLPDCPAGQARHFYSKRLTDQDAWPIGTAETQPHDRA